MDYLTDKQPFKTKFDDNSCFSLKENDDKSDGNPSIYLDLCVEKPLVTQVINKIVKQKKNTGKTNQSFMYNQITPSPYISMHCR